MENVKIKTFYDRHGHHIEDEVNEFMARVIVLDVIVNIVRNTYGYDSLSYTVIYQEKEVL